MNIKHTIKILIANIKSILRKGRNKNSKSNPISYLLRVLFENPLAKKSLGFILTSGTLILSLIIPETIYTEYNKPILENISINAPTELITNESLRYPLNNKVIINQHFRSYHQGIDLQGELGDPVYPVTEGVIRSTTYQNFAYGNHIIIDHTNGLTSLYAHLNKIFVTPGQQIGKYSILGEVGSTGKSTGSHLHLEVYYQNQALNPYNIIIN